MVIKSIIGAVCTYLAVVSFNVSAIPTEDIGKLPANGLITFVANSGLEWLDFTYTSN